MCESNYYVEKCIQSSNGQSTEVASSSSDSSSSSSTSSASSMSPSSPKRMTKKIKSHISIKCASTGVRNTLVKKEVSEIDAESAVATVEAVVAAAAASSFHSSSPSVSSSSFGAHDDDDDDNQSKSETSSTSSPRFDPSSGIGKKRQRFLISLFIKLSLSRSMKILTLK